MMNTKAITCLTFGMFFVLSSQQCKAEGIPPSLKKHIDRERESRKKTIATLQKSLDGAKKNLQRIQSRRILGRGSRRTLALKQIGRAHV